MPLKISKVATDVSARMKGIEALDVCNNPLLTQFSNQSFGMIVTDDAGIERLIEVRFIAVAVDEDMTASEILADRVKTWEEKKAKKLASDLAKEEKARKDAEKRAKKKKEAEGE